MHVTAATSVAKSSGTIPKCSCRLQRFQRESPHSNSADVHIKRHKRGFAVRAARSGDFKRRPNMVDADMLVLRRRMHQLRMEEINYLPPQNWMAWEKKWYSTYDSDVCAFLVWLQNRLLNTRPCVAVGIMALISFSIPALVVLLFIEGSDHLLRAHVSLWLRF